MISSVLKVAVYVRDQQRALDFYTGALGFEVRADQPMGPGARWIEVGPPGAATGVTLWTPPDLADRIGTFTGIVFGCADIEATVAGLRGRGVTFTEEPSGQAGGVMATFLDPDDNVFVLRENT
ncbi:VOC family protein [Amycolatopsis sp. cmx-11-12]|uniref:VOC family protein n=1 Tax=Amycolatopsis sp. cmx-11-12 TaxID=2785795 RepID=UPI003917F177